MRGEFPFLKRVASSPIQAQIYCVFNYRHIYTSLTLEKGIDCHLIVFNSFTIQYGAGYATAWPHPREKVH
jgi:hypothetical protein